MRGWYGHIEVYNDVTIALYDYCFTAQVLKVCRTPGPTACSKTKMVHLDKVCLKS